MKKIIVTESDKKEILSKHLKEFAVDIDDVVICDWLSPDEKYVIFLDELLSIFCLIRINVSLTCNK
jgi:hypothetical protein